MNSGYFDAYAFHYVFLEGKGIAALDSACVGRRGLLSPTVPSCGSGRACVWALASLCLGVLLLSDDCTQSILGCSGDRHTVIL